MYILFLYLFALSVQNDTSNINADTILSNSTLDSNNSDIVIAPRNYTQIVTTTAEVGATVGAGYGAWRLLSSFAKAQGGMMLGWMLSDFPEFKKWLHAITGEVSDEDHYQFLLGELNNFLGSKTHNHIQISEAPELMTWIRDTEEGSHFAVKAFMNKYRSHLKEEGKEVALGKWRILSDRLNIHDDGFANKVAQSHLDFKQTFDLQSTPMFKGSDIKSVNLLSFPEIVTKKVERIESPSFLRKMKNLWVNIPHKGVILTIAGTVLGGAIIATLLMRHARRKQQERNPESLPIIPDHVHK